VFRKLATFTICSLADCASSRASFPALKSGYVSAALYPWNPAGTPQHCGRSDGPDAPIPDYGSSTPAGHLSRILSANFVLTSQADESHQQTRAVYRSVAATAEGKGTALSNLDVARWRAVETCLRWAAGLGRNQVLVPFANKIAELAAADQLRGRRDFSSVLSLTMASALLHQWQRQWVDGHIVADMTDYQYALWAVSKELAATANGVT
jgi:hypothetical protein